MKENLLDLLKNRSHTFSKGQKLLANYITQAYDKVAFMTAAKLGKTVGVSESTVVRFATELGFDGYPEMQYAIQSLMFSESENVPQSDLLSSVMQADIDNIRQTADLLDRELVAKSVKALLDADTIYILGNRTNATIAEFFADRLEYIFDNVHILTGSDSYETLEKLFRVGAKDVVVAFAFPQYAIATVKAAEHCHDAGATVIGMTDSGKSPIARYCDYLLLAKCKEYDFLDSLSAPFSLVNALIVMLTAEREKNSSGTLDLWQQVRKKYQI